jgi:hypothetical protein
MYLGVSGRNCKAGLQKYFHITLDVFKDSIANPDLSTLPHEVYLSAATTTAICMYITSKQGLG